jgi:hypothetical protein
MISQPRRLSLAGAEVTKTPLPVYPGVVIQRGPENVALAGSHDITSFEYDISQSSASQH